MGRCAAQTHCPPGPWNGTTCTGSEDEGVAAAEARRVVVGGVYRQHGFEFRDYARSSLRRRVRNAVQAECVDTISPLHARVLHDRECFERFLLGVSVNVSAVFRDPSFFLTFRREVVPLLRTYPFIRIWQAGCSIEQLKTVLPTL